MNMGGAELRSKVCEVCDAMLDVQFDAKKRAVHGRKALANESYPKCHSVN